jgi:hypothetical protein
VVAARKGGQPAEEKNMDVLKIKKVTNGTIHGVCSWTGIHFPSRIVAQNENGGCVRDSAGNWYGVIMDGRIGLELELAYERDVLKRKQKSTSNLRSRRARG